jgi:hypothetical protein
MCTTLLYLHAVLPAIMGVRYLGVRCLANLIYLSTRHNYCCVHKQISISSFSLQAIFTGYSLMYPSLGIPLFTSEQKVLPVVVHVISTHLLVPAVYTNQWCTYNLKQVYI